MKIKTMFIGVLGAICANSATYAYDGYNIPCSDGGSGSCICDAGSCLDETWDDTLGTFMCGSGRGESYSCNCVDAQFNKTITFTCGCYSDSDCGGGFDYGCINNRCQKCKSCSGASTGAWTAHSTGYEKRTVKTCTCSGTLNTRTEYRCAAGYYGSSSNGTSGCTRCPSSGGVYGSSAAGSTAITACYLPSGTSFSDGTGSGKYTGNCYYKN